jgi:hypothetical protein
MGSPADLQLKGLYENLHLWRQQPAVRINEVDRIIRNTLVGKKFDEVPVADPVANNVYRQSNNAIAVKRCCFMSNACISA